MFTFYQYVAVKWLHSAHNFNKNPLQSWSKLFLWTVDLTEVVLLQIGILCPHSPCSKNMGSFLSILTSHNESSPSQYPRLSLRSFNSCVVSGYASNVWSFPFTQPLIYEKYRNIVTLGASVSLSNVAELNKYILKVLRHLRYKIILNACFL